jgi:hypothetical protein
MNTTLRHLESAIKGIARENNDTLRFISKFQGSSGNSLRSRWELWLQIELLRQLEKLNSTDLYFEHRLEYKSNKRKGAGKAEFNTGSLDLAFRPKSADKGLLVGVEIKVRPTPSGAIRGGLHDLIKPSAFKSREGAWPFRAIYAMCVFPKDMASEDSTSKYLQFLQASEYAKMLKLGDEFCVALIGWEEKPRSGSTGDFYKSYGDWVKEMIAEASRQGLRINTKRSPSK